MINILVRVRKRHDDGKKKRTVKNLRVGDVTSWNTRVFGGKAIKISTSELQCLREVHMSTLVMVSSYKSTVICGYRQRQFIVFNNA